MQATNSDRPYLHLFPEAEARITQHIGKFYPEPAYGLLSTRMLIASALHLLEEGWKTRDSTEEYIKIILDIGKEKHQICLEIIELEAQRKSDLSN